MIGFRSRRNPSSATPAGVSRAIAAILGLTALASCSVPLERRIAAELRSVMGNSSAVARGDLSEEDWKTLHQLYQKRDFRPLWTLDSRPTPQAAALLRALRDAPADGLDSTSLSTRWLEPTARRLRRERSPAVRQIAEFDARLTGATARYLVALGRGQIPPEALGWELRERPDLDLADLLSSMSAAKDPILEIKRLQPSHPQYRALRKVLRRYRALLAAGWNLPRFKAPLRSNQKSSQVPALRRLLVAVGDMPPSAAHPRDSLRMDGRVVRALKHFQRRHGIPAVGHLDSMTVAELNVPLGTRVRQIELSMERWRSQYRVGSAPYVVVNLAAFSLEYVGGSGSPSDRLRQRVVVGKATDSTMTPLLVSRAGRVVVWPYWNVPVSIVRNEILPEFLKDSTYIERNHYEIVRFATAESPPLPATLENLDKVIARGLLLRQRPGPWNPLGQAKLLFPNKYEVYLHGSPAREYFSRRRRDVSHGCVRVDDILTLAERVLQEQPEWDPKVMEEALEDSVEVPIDLRRTVPIYFIYATAVASEQGEVFFYHDLYGHDARLDSLLQAEQVKKRGS